MKVSKQATIKKQFKANVAVMVDMGVLPKEAQLGIHYRPHRKTPKAFIVVKLWNSFPREWLTAYMQATGLLSKATYKLGSRKHVYIVPRDKFEQRHLEQAAEAAEAQVQTTAKIQATLETKEETKVEVKGPEGFKPSWEPPKFALGEEQVEQKLGQSSWTPGKFTLG